MAIGSEGEIGVKFLTGTENINYPWIVDGVQHQLMHGDSKVIYICGRPDNVYSRFAWQCQNGCCKSEDYNGEPQ